MDPYSTHLSPLVEWALGARGAILELGCGHYSTPVLAHIARHRGVPFMVMSADKMWSAKFQTICRIELVQDWTKADFPEADVVLLDNEQKTADRIRLLPALAQKARVVVVHDLEACSGHAHWREMTETFRSLTRYVEHSPGTGVLTC